MTPNAPHESIRHYSPNTLSSYVSHIFRLQFLFTVIKSLRSREKVCGELGVKRGLEMRKCRKDGVTFAFNE